MTGIARFRAYCKKKILSDNTVRTYNSFINNFIFWIEENGYTNMVAAEITEWTIEEFLDQQVGEENWIQTYNNHLKFFNTLLPRMKKLEKRENAKLKGYNVDFSGIELKKDRAEKNRYYSPVVAGKVKKELVGQLLFIRPRHKNPSKILVLLFSTAGLCR